MPSLSKSFETATIPAGEVVRLTFVLTNDTEVDMTEVSFTDTLPLDMIIATPNGLVNPSSLATITAVEGTNEIDLSGGTVGGGETITFAVSVIAPTPGVYSNETSNLTTDEDGEIAFSSAEASIAALQSGILSQWILMRFDMKIRHEEEA